MTNMAITMFICLVFGAAVYTGSMKAASADAGFNCRAEAVHASWLKSINAKIDKARQSNPNFDATRYFQKRDLEVVRHEQAHLAAACEWGVAIRYLKTQYKGRSYRTAGCTQIRGNAPAQIAYLSALAPLVEGIEPSAYDRRVAQATQRLIRAMRNPWQKIALCPAAAKVKDFLTRVGEHGARGKKSGPRIIYGK